MPAPEEGLPKLHVDWTDLNNLIGKIGIPPQLGLAERPGIDLNVLSAEAEEAACKDIEKIQEVGQRLIYDLDSVDVDLLEPNPFKVPASKASLARKSADAVMRAREYLSLVIGEGPVTEQGIREYATVVTQAWAAKSAFYIPAFEAQAEILATDITTVRDQQDELGRMRRELKQEQQTDPAELRAFEISNILSAIDSLETVLKLRIVGSEHASDGLDFMQQLKATDKAVAEAANWMWQDRASLLLTIERRRHRRSGRRRRIYAAILLGYALIIVIVGVVADAALALTPVAGIVTSLATAFGLFAVDRLLINPWLERWNRLQNVRILKDEIGICVITLANIRQIQVNIDTMAGYTGVPKKQLLSPRLLM